MNHKILAAITALLFATNGMCQTTSEGAEPARPFRANIINNDYNVLLNINLYDNDIVVPGQEVFGLMSGYLLKPGTTFYWFVTSADISDDGRQATLHMTNDYGSEDLTAMLTCDNDSVYTLKQLKGSTLKVPKDGKWQKLPKTLTLKRKK